MNLNWLAYVSFIWIFFHVVGYPDMQVLEIISNGVLLLIFGLFLNWFFSLGIWNKRKCGHESDSYRYVAGERMWMCHECYWEYTYDRLGIGRCDHELPRCYENEQL